MRGAGVGPEPDEQRRQKNRLKPRATAEERSASSAPGSGRVSAAMPSKPSLIVLKSVSDTKRLSRCVEDVLIYFL